jgi:hypothetical protein
MPYVNSGRNVSVCYIDALVKYENIYDFVFISSSWVYFLGQVVLQMEKLELVDALLNLCSYRHPTDITLPKG